VEKGPRDMLAALESLMVVTRLSQPPATLHATPKFILPKRLLDVRILAVRRSSTARKT
jgi:hypothetical protein